MRICQLRNRASASSYAPPAHCRKQNSWRNATGVATASKTVPQNAIIPLESTRADLNNTPYIDPDEQPCVICDSLACMYVCPSGALQTVYAEDIRMGLAVFNAETCLRTKEIACTYCVDTCPIGDDANSPDSRRGCRSD